MIRTEHPKIDCVVRVITPENIEFEYMVAGPFQRLPAFILDFMLRISIFMALVFGSLMVGLSLGIGSPFLTFAVGAIAFFILSWMYGAIMETQFNGRTVGKMMFGLRVISSDGRPINASQAALRNLLRLCDFMPPLSLTLLSPQAPAIDLIPTCFIGLTAMILTSRMQRVGDLAAGTMVVWEGRRGFHTNLQPEDLRVYSLAELIPPTFQISRTMARAVALYMERRVYLSPQRREEVAGNLAQPLFPLFNLKPDTSADLLLCAIYVRIYHSQEHREQQLAAARKPTAERSSPTISRPSAVPPTGWLQPQSGAGFQTSGQALANASHANTSPANMTNTTAIAEDIITADVITADVVNAKLIDADVVDENLPDQLAQPAPNPSAPRSAP